MKEYQPIVKNLKDMALRNRNFVSNEKVKMPVMNCESLSERFPGMTKVKGTVEDPSSPRR